MSEWQTVSIQTQTLSDGRLFITDLDACQQPHVMEFIDRYSNYWQPDPLLCGWVSPTIEGEIAPKQIGAFA